MAENVDRAQEEIQQNIEQWKLRRIIANLDQARGAATSLISLICPPKEQISIVNKMITEEYGKASNIKSKSTKNAVQSAITSVKEKLKLYPRLPKNGLIIYCGEVLNERGDLEKRYCIDIEPPKPINTSGYICDNRFRTEVLKELLVNDQKFGFIIMDGNGALFGTLQGATKDIIHKFTVELPKKHGRGGQSAMRFGRLRLEKRHNYVRKVSESAVTSFITNDRPNVTGIVLAGSAEFKHELRSSGLLDQRLDAIILCMLDVSYGGENGFTQAIELAGETLANVKFVREKKLISKFFEEIATDSRKYTYGVENTLKCLEMGAVEKLIVWDALETVRIRTRNSASGSENVIFLTPAMAADSSTFYDQTTGFELEKLEE
jgi:peptide chain release factor subunit 1